MRIAPVTLAILIAAGRVAAAETIQDIVVENNAKTTSDTVTLIAKIEIGDEWSPDMSDRIKEDLVSSGLFKDVEVFSEPCGPNTHPACADPGVRVHLLATDKHSWVIAPAVYNQPTNKGGGIGYGENNLFGLNQKLLLYGQVATGDSFFIGAWVVPAIAGTRFYTQVDTYLKSSRNFEYAAPRSYLSNPKAVRESRMHYYNGGIRLGIELFRGFKIDTRLRAAKLSYVEVKLASGASIEQVTGDPTSDPNAVPAPGKEGWDISNEWTMTIDRRANWYGIQSGYKYTLSFEHTLDSLGTDFHYYELELGIFRAWKVLERHNLVFRSAWNYGHHMPFQQEFTTGGTSMRGYLNNQFRGDFKASANLEYSVPLFTISGLSFRGLGFFDSAYTTFLTTSNPERTYLPGSRRDQQDSVFAPFKNSVGVGTRLYLRQIVLPLLGLDFGYGLEARDYQVYLAIGLTD